MSNQVEKDNGDVHLPVICFHVLHPFRDIRELSGSYWIESRDGPL